MSATLNGYNYNRTVTVVPSTSTGYTWSNTGSSWITITRVGTSDAWDIEVATNTGSTRSATLTVLHEDGTTSNSMTVDQAGVVLNNLNPTYDSIAASATTMDETDAGSSGNDTITFTINSTDITVGTTVNWTIVPSQISSPGVNSADVINASGTLYISGDVVTITIQAVADQLTEGTEFGIFQLASTDSAGNSTGGLQHAFTVADTSQIPEAFVFNQHNTSGTRFTYPTNSNHPDYEDITYYVYADGQGGTYTPQGPYPFSDYLVTGQDQGMSLVSPNTWLGTYRFSRTPFYPTNNLNIDKAVSTDVHTATAYLKVLAYQIPEVTPDLTFDNG